MKPHRGIVCDEGTSLIKKEFLMAIRNRTYTYSKQTKPKHVFIFCDPNAGGDDHMALVAAVFVEGKIVVCIFFFMLFIASGETD